MTPAALLQHLDSGALWPGADATLDVPTAYRLASQVRALRIARGEVPKGYKIGFTNRTIWERYKVFGPIWGTVWSTTLTRCAGVGLVSLANTCQPRLEPEVVFGMKATPAPQATLDDLFSAIDWVAPGFEVVQSHMPDWKFTAPDTVADSGLHARLLVGPTLAPSAIAADAAGLDTVLGNLTVSLLHGAEIRDTGRGSNVLDSPLRALHHFLNELRHCPGATDLLAGDVVTTGTLTDAWPVRSGQTWHARFGAPLSTLTVSFR